MVRVKQNGDDATGLALVAALGVGIGVIGGILLGEFLGGVNATRVRDAARRLLASGDDVPRDPKLIEETVTTALHENPETSGAQVGVHALGDGIVELTGTAPDAIIRQLAGDIARDVPGAVVVVNRILVEDG